MIGETKFDLGVLLTLKRAVERCDDVILITEAEPIEEPGPRIIYVNPAFERATGYSAAEVIGKTPRILQGPKTDRAALDRIHDALKARQPAREELVNYRKDGSEFSADLSIMPIADEQGWFTHWFALQRDSTEEYLQQERLRLAHHAAGIGTFDVEFPSGRRTWSARAFEIFGLDPDGPQPGAEDILRMVHPEDRSMVAEQMKVLTTGQRLHFEYRIVRTDGEIRWVEIEGSGIFDQDGVLTRYLGVGRDITERKRAEEAVLASQEFAQSTIDAIRSNICVLDECGNIVAVNRAWRQFWLDNRGNPEIETSGTFSFLGAMDFARNYLEVCDKVTGPDAGEAAEFATQIRAVLAGEVDTFAKKYACHSPGKERWFLCRVTRYMSNGIFRAVVEHIDISGQRRIEEMLSESGEQSRIFFEYAPAALATFDDQMRYLQVSRRWRSDYGLGRRDVRGMSHYDLFPETPEHWRDAHRRGLAGEVVCTEEDQMVRSDGSVQWFRWEVHPWRDAQQRIGGIMIFVEDITERKLVAESLRVNEERLRLAHDAGGIATFDLDVASGRRQWSPRMFEIFGLPRDSPQPQFEEIRHLIHPQDRAKIAATPDVLASGTHGQREYRIVRPDGEIRWIEAFGRGMFDEKGQPTRYLGVAWDSTERKRVEEKLRRSEEELRALAARVQTAAENERMRMARELHDQVGQALTGLRMDLEWIVRKCDGESAGETCVPLVQDAMKAVDSTIALVRRLSTELRPQMLDALGLRAAIEWHSAEFQRRTGIECVLDLSPQPVGFSAEQKIGVFRIFQEALTNIVRHAKAKKVTISFQRQADWAMLIVRDDGIGFLLSEDDRAKSLGLLGMRERAHMLGANLSIHSVPDQGTSVLLRVPLAKD